MRALRAEVLAIAAAAAVAAASACGGRRGPDRPLTVRDSAGVEIVEVAETVLDTLRQWSLDSGALVIGSLDGLPEYELHLAASPWRLSDGRIVVANARSEIRYYDSAGRHLRTVGGRGAGPGQYRQLWNLYPLEGDSLLAFDVLGRVSILSPSGDFVRSHPFPLRASGPLQQWLPDHGASLYDDFSPRALSRAPASRAVIQDTALLLVADATGQVRDTLDRLPGVWWLVTGFNWSGVDLSGHPLLAAGSDVVVAGHGDAFALRWYRLDHGLARITRVRAMARPVTPREVASVEADMRALARRYPGVGREGTPQRPTYSEALPFVTALLIDRVGRAWVRRWALDHDPLAPWIVFDTTGWPLARIEMPGAFRPSDIGEDYVLGVLRDPDATDEVRRYHLSRAPGPAVSSGPR